MFTNKKYKIHVIVLILCCLFNITSVYAEDVKNKIDEQNQTIYDGIIENRKEDGNSIDKVLDHVDQKENETLDISGMGGNIEKASIKLSLAARKYIIPITILIIIFNVFMLTVTGAKNMSNRKRYIVGSIFLYILFLIVLNFPIYLLWRYSSGKEGIFLFKDFYGFVNSVISFFRDNSFVFSVIVFSYGIVNYISSETNLPKRKASTYMMKMSIIMFFMFQALPFIMKLAI